MAKIIKSVDTTEEVSYSLNFYFKGEVHYGFPCDVNGKVEELHSGGQANYDRVSKDARFESAIEDEYHTVRGYIVVQCACGVEMEIHNDLDQCECGQHYNPFGQEILAPADWRENDGSDEYLDYQDED